MQVKKQFAKFRMLQIEEGKHVYVIYTFLLHGHECFTGKYSTRKIHKNYIPDPSGLFSVLSREFNFDVISVYFLVNAHVYIIKSRKHYFTLSVHSFVKYCFATRK